MPQLIVQPLGKAAQLADSLALPIMRLIAREGESPQLTHFWNNVRMDRAMVDHLEPELMVACEGDPNAVHRMTRLDLRFHVGGWSRYVVLAPMGHDLGWYVGWRTARGAGVSRIPIPYLVRMLIGPEDVEFFGIRKRDAEQIPLWKKKIGELGINSGYQWVPLH